MVRKAELQASIVLAGLDRKAVFPRLVITLLLLATMFKLGG